METIARLFRNGRSQAVRLPKEFRFEGDRVRITKDGKRVILEPLEQDEWPEGFWKKFSKDPDFEIPKPLPSKPLDLD